MAYSKSYTVDEATKLLEHYCAYQERSHREVEHKLLSMKMIPAAQEKILIHLMQENYLNEERYAKAFVRGKFSIKKWGRRKIQNELKIKGISNFNIKTALAEIEEEEYLAILKSLAIKKEATIKESNIFKKRKKLQTYLIGRGYEPTLVYEITIMNK